MVVQTCDRRNEITRSRSPTITTYRWALIIRVYFRRGPVWRVRLTRCPYRLPSPVSRVVRKKRFLSFRDVDSKWLLTVRRMYGQRTHELKISLPPSIPWEMRFVDLGIAILTYTSRSSALRSPGRKVLFIPP